MYHHSVAKHNDRLYVQCLNPNDPCISVRTESGTYYCSKTIYFYQVPLQK